MRRDRQDGFTTRVRQELAGHLPDRDCDATAQLAALVVLGATVESAPDGSTGPASVEIVSRSGAVARNFFRLVQRIFPAAQPDLHVVPRRARAPSRYRVRVDGPTGLLDTVGVRAGEPGTQIETLASLTGARCDRIAFARGALLASGSVSGPGRPPHLEIVAAERPVAQVVADCVAAAADHDPGLSRTGTSWRVVLKSGEAIGTLLAALGAQRAFLEHDERRLRRELRSEANRLANADSANVRRAIAAAANQVEVVERALDHVGWEDIDDDLREVALARLANPEATIAEIGELCDPPVGKSTVHRRLARLERLADD